MAESTTREKHTVFYVVKVTIIQRERFPRDINDRFNMG